MALLTGIPMICHAFIDFFFLQIMHFKKYIQLPLHTERTPKLDMMTTVGTCRHYSDLCPKQAKPSDFHDWFGKTTFSSPKKGWGRKEFKPGNMLLL